MIIFIDYGDDFDGCGVLGGIAKAVEQAAELGRPSSRRYDQGKEDHTAVNGLPALAASIQWAMNFRS
ncbi:MAG: hypothetical protein DMG58_19585 [Acidobacteria bacterium]|nr:MAG: hypothetical protein DMG58_19585 [Acidobacteriota bacterium]